MAEENKNAELQNVFKHTHMNLKEIVMSYVSFMVTVKQKPIVNTQKVKKKDS